MLYKRKEYIMTQEREQELLKKTTAALLKYAPHNTGWLTWISSMTSITAEELNEINNNSPTKVIQPDELKKHIDFLNMKDNRYNWNAVRRNNVIDVFWGGSDSDNFTIVPDNNEYYKVYTSNGKYLNTIKSKSLQETLLKLFYYCINGGIIE